MLHWSIPQSFLHSPFMRGIVVDARATENHTSILIVAAVPFAAAKPVAMRSRPCHLHWMTDVRALLAKLRRLLQSRGRSSDDIDDLMQEAFLRLQTYCKDRTVQNTEAFLVRTVLNLSAEQGRRSRTRQMASETVQVLAELSKAPTPDEVYSAQQRLLTVRSGLERIGPRSREAFLMHRLDGLSYTQIAEELGVSVSMVEKHIARASFFLRDWMARSEE
jgi:RNA polymerase sigma factor (sigma-70 family)